MHYYCSRDTKCKQPFGAIAACEEVSFTVYAESGVYVHSAHLVLCRDGGMPVSYQMRFSGLLCEESVFKVSVKIPDCGLYFYHFKINDERGTVLLKRGQNAIATNFGDEYTLLVYDKNYKTPDWLKGGIIYHIFIDRFKRGDDPEAVFVKNGVLKGWGDPVTVVDPDGVFRANDFYGGNFQGVIDKLDHLETLGVTLIYLSPVFKSASNHRYDTGDYTRFDELLGTDEKFKELIAKAKACGMGVMLDGVFNHTGADSLYFNKFGNYDGLGAYQSEKSKYFDWYYFDKFPDDYRSWWGVTVSPTVNKQNKAYRSLILGKNGVIEKYTKMGVKGWRLDVADELDIDFLDDLRKTVKRADKDAVIIGEVWEDASTKVSYGKRRPYLSGKQLDGVMNYPFKNLILEYVFNGNAAEFSDSVMTIVENYPKQALNVCMNIVGTHDTWRVLNTCAGVDVSNLTKSERDKVRIDGDTLAYAIMRLKLAVVLEFFLPGVPSIYYGDEVGLDGYDDPLSRKPMPWDAFNHEIFDFYKKITKIRKSHPHVFTGTLRCLNRDGLLVLERRANDECLRLIMNATNEQQDYRLDGSVKDLMSNRQLSAGTQNLKPKSFLLF